MALVSSRCACVSVNVRVKKYYTHGIWAEEGHGGATRAGGGAELGPAPEGPCGEWG